MTALDRVRATLEQRAAAGLRRELRPRAAGEDLLDLAGNDYLALAKDPRVIEGAVRAARTWGAGAGGSRLVTGTTELHTQLECELAAFVAAPAALVFSSGYLANLGVLSALGGPEVTIVSDVGNHASIIDACRLSGSTVAVTPHRDLDTLAGALASVETEHALVVTDAVFSVDGDRACLREMHAIARRHHAILVVDEAHSLGVVGSSGAGAVEAEGLAAETDVVRTLTLSKSLGAQGGAVAAAPEVIELLINTARPFIFDTALAPSAAGAAQAALRALIAEPERVTAVRAHADGLAAVVRHLGVQTVVPEAAVVPAFVGDPRRAVHAAAVCLRHGVRVGCFRPPSVPVGRSCLRLTARADLTEAGVDRAAVALAEALR